MFLVVQGYYAQATVCPPQQVQVKYIPRSLYEEQLPSEPQKEDDKPITRQFKSMFEDVDPRTMLASPVLRKTTMSPSP